MKNTLENVALVNMVKQLKPTAVYYKKKKKK